VASHQQEEVVHRRADLRYSRATSRASRPTLCLRCDVVKGHDLRDTHIKLNQAMPSLLLQRSKLTLFSFVARMNTVNGFSREAVLWEDCEKGQRTKDMPARRVDERIVLGQRSPAKGQPAPCLAKQIEALSAALGTPPPLMIDACAPCGAPTISSRQSQANNEQSL
jgi:hypothetical protein